MYILRVPIKLGLEIPVCPALKDVIVLILFSLTAHKEISFFLNYRMSSWIFNDIYDVLIGKIKCILIDVYTW